MAFAKKKLEDFGYSKHIKTLDVDFSDNTSPCICIDFGSQQQAYSITDKLGNDGVYGGYLWVSHIKDYHFGFQGTYSSKVEIRPKWSLKHETWDNLDSMEKIRESLVKHNKFDKDNYYRNR